MTVILQVESSAVIGDNLTHALLRFGFTTHFMVYDLAILLMLLSLNRDLPRQEFISDPKSGGLSTS